MRVEKVQGVLKWGKVKEKGFLLLARLTSSGDKRKGLW